MTAIGKTGGVLVLAYFITMFEIALLGGSIYVANMKGYYARASEQGNVIGLVSVYICVCTKKNCN